MATNGKSMTVKEHREEMKTRFFKEGVQARANRGRKRVEIEREKIEQDLEEYLKNGGLIEVLPGPLSGRVKPRAGWRTE